MSDEAGVIDRPEAIDRPDEEDLIHFGWIKKQGGGIRNWKHRFAVLTKDKLCYYKKDFDGVQDKERRSSVGKRDRKGSAMSTGSEAGSTGSRGRPIDAKDQQGEIAVADISTVRVSEGSEKPFVFEIVTAKRTYYFRANDQAEMVAWLQALNAPGTEKDDGTWVTTRDDGSEVPQPAMPASDGDEAQQVVNASRHASRPADPDRPDAKITSKMAAANLIDNSPFPITIKGSWLMRGNLKPRKSYVFPNDNVRHAKTRIAQKYGWRISNDFELKYKGRTLKNTEKMRDIGISEGESLTLGLSMKPVLAILIGLMITAMGALLIVDDRDTDLTIPGIVFASVGLMIVFKFVLCGISSSPLDYMWGSKIAEPRMVPGSLKYTVDESV